MDWKDLGRQYVKAWRKAHMDVFNCKLTLVSEMPDHVPLRVVHEDGTEEAEEEEEEEEEEEAEGGQD